ncbi:MULTISPECIES: GNAT family N-acetyltransferase [Microbacterium]|uniref:GNAT family N-acetyltransferase n=1 Tax=Microbacterium TaxID=33882 RepID=UPI0007013840|nr:MULTISPECIES: GNAT family N-acetyltransferase [unclassified Microbacterium]MBN9199143.1 GNAT family N-acetyltransferase [Microbacterium ginsengisoli]MCK9914843.1 GNAT family N-acetyltransferase [Microbacteriaceae bacterium K1510]KQR99254.1 hypothetical protein ASF93_12360 [Microbacterium sp. Leaf347]KQS02562.1 hypothetical protein ASG00_09540 [Microbacterium sp. Leaf351]ODU72506.1 MAG: hypothetical protein ABT08_12645 [Microbacterium sp. SCN 71-21]
MTAASDSLTIREARPDEYVRAGEATVSAYTSAYGALTDEYIASLRDVAARADGGEVWLALDGDEILGTVWMSRPGEALSHLARPGETDFRQLAVTPAAQRRGVGAALVHHVIAQARARGSHRVVMNSGPEMTGAHALYARLGFVRLPEREHPVEVQPGRFIDLLAFGYDLTPA